MTKFYNSLVKIACILSLLLFIGSNVWATTYPVTNTASSGAGSLAQAITDANANPGKDLITFAIPGSPATIALTSALPNITEAVVIDGYSQTGAIQGSVAGRTIMVNIDGTGLAAGTNIFNIAANDVEIDGLAIYKAPQYGIASNTSGSNIFIWGNYIGTDNTGTSTTLGNGKGGISINEQLTSTQVTRVIIGTNGDGVNDGNEGNLVSCNKATSVSAGGNGDGIALWTVKDGRVSGNIIGLDKNGSNGSFGNDRNGILVTVDALNDTIGTNGDNISDALEANIICNNGTINSGHGVHIAGRSHLQVVAGNTIGITPTNGNAGNAINGIQITSAYDTRIGTNADGVSDALEANTICSNGGSGIGITAQDFFSFNSNTTGNVIAGNFIGTEATGTLVAGNAVDGITIVAANDGVGSGMSASDNIIGSNGDNVNDAAEGNVIANNTGVGIQLNPATPTAQVTGIKISRNSMYNNIKQGIEMLYIGSPADAVPANDQDDVDAGPNNLLNFPVLTATKVDASGNLYVAGFTRPGTVLELYIADGGTYPIPHGGYTKNFGQGKTFLYRVQEGTTLNGVTDDSTATNTYTSADQGISGGPATITENQFGFNIPAGLLAAPVSATMPITAIAYETVTGTGNTSVFSGSSPIILPIHLISFKGRVNDGKSYLTWTTAQESNNSHFDVERSTNGSTYTSIASVTARTALYNEYNFTDNGPLAAVNYYRLKQVDRDGKFTYSPVIILRADLGASVSARATPNPFTGNINLSYRLTRTETVQVRLFDQMGRIVRNYSIKGGTGINTFNMSNLNSLPSGFYTLELKGEKLSFIQQLIK